MPFLIPVVATALAVSTITATVIVYVGTMAVSFGLSYLAGKLLNKPDQGQPGSVGGTQLDIRVDADVPRSVIFGRAATAGSLVHAQTYGLNPGTSVYATVHNTHLVEVVAIADHPCDALEQVFVEGQLVTLGASVGDRGQEIQDAGYTGSGGSKDLAVKFYDGTQTTADQWSIDTIGSHSEFPWTSAFIGRGITYARTDSRYNTNRVTGRLRWKYVVRGIKLYDPRLDTTVGGSGSHLFNDTSTHTWTENVAVICYNILRGVYVLNPSAQRQFLYGVEGTTADQLPLAEWFAAMNECDVLVTTEGSLTEAQYRAGGEIPVDTEPLEVIKELLKASGGRLVEIGGIYKLYIGAPGASVATFNDGDLLSTEGDSFKPVLGLEDRINYITATYTSDDEDWVPKVAPPRSSATWEAEDGRRLPADLQVPMVQSRFQTQRLMQQMLFRSRQQRKHQIPLSRMLFYVEPGDVVTWNSTRNGYTAKLFEVDGVDYHPNLNVSLTLTEIDPADYDWTPGTDTLPEVISQPISVAPDPKVVTGFAAAPYTQTGTTGVERPGILLTWDDPLDGDVTAVLWQLRVAADPTNITSGRHEEVEDEALVIISGLAPETNYEVRAKFESFEGYPSDWSLWIAVTTPVVNELSQDALDGILDDAYDRIENLSQLVGDQGQIILSQNDVLIGVQSNLNDLNATGTFRIIAVTAPDDALAAVEAEVRASAGAVWAEAAMQMLAYANVDGTATSRLRFIADSIQFGQPGETGGDFIQIVEIANHNGTPSVVIRGELYKDNVVGVNTLIEGAAATVISRSTTADNISRTYTAWQNGGAGEVAATITVAFDGDGPVDVLFSFNTDDSSVVAVEGWFILELNSVEIWREICRGGTSTQGQRFAFFYTITSGTLTGTNTLVVKLFHDGAGAATTALTKIQWRVIEYHKPAVQAGGAVAAAITYRTAQSAGGVDTMTLSTVAIGTAAANRRVVVGIGYRSSVNNINGILIGGVDAERVANRRSASMVGQLWAATVPTGTTADVVIVASGNLTEISAAVWTITTMAEAIIDDATDVAELGGSPLVAANLEIQMGGVVIAFAWGFNTSAFSGTWTGVDAVTEAVEAAGASLARYGGYHFLTTESTMDDDFSFAHGASSSAHVVVSASWR